MTPAMEHLLEYGSIDELTEVWLNPARAYCRRVLQLTVAGDDPPLDDVEPMAVDALRRTKAQQRMVQRTLEGHRDPSRERALAVASGDLPVAALGTTWYDVLRQDAAPMLSRATRVIARDGELLIPGITDAHALLDLLVQGVRAARSAPLPYFLEAAYAYRQQVRKDRDGAMEAAHRAYHREPNDFDSGGDRANGYVNLLWRGRDPIAEYPHRFAALADGFWARFDEVTAS
ncbi:MAG: hypothetical protein EBV77_03550 [Gemmatimonadaceae bacterium]|nr:hypothetical protein [Gemmatimonadaceae bacterium]